MPPNDLIIRDQLAVSLYNAVHEGGHGLEAVPALIKKALETEIWRERIVQITGQRIDGFKSFVEYVHATPPEGLGATVPLIEKLTAGDPAAVDLLDRALKRQHGGNRSAGKDDNINLAPKPTGTSVEQAIRRLRKDRPDLHARVLAGELSAHAAAVEAGFRQQTLTVPADPDAGVAALVRKFGLPAVLAAIQRQAS